jgi:hypothetical protein
MQFSGVSAPPSLPHGQGRRKIEPEAHGVIQEDHSDWIAPKNQGRKLIVPDDHFSTDILKPFSDQEVQRPPTNQDMKNSVEEWILQQYGMAIANQQRWQDEVHITTRGSHWVIEALTEQRKTITREGPTARHLAEKLSLMTLSDLRYFGLRFSNAVKGCSITEPRTKRTPEAGFNATMHSPGIHSAFGESDGRPQGGGRPDGPSHEFSASRKDPHDAVQRRYIASGRDHFSGEAHETIGRGTLGAPRDVDFSEGLERGIGHGRRFIGSQSSLAGGCQVR